MELSNNPFRLRSVWHLASPTTIDTFVCIRSISLSTGENYITKWDGPYPREGFSKECFINWVSHQSTNRSQEKGDSESICERPNWHCPTSLGSLDKTANTKSEGILCMRSRNHTYQHKTRLTIPATVWNWVFRKKWHKVFQRCKCQNNRPTR